MQKLDRSGKWLLAGLGFLLIGLCLAALSLGNLRSHQYIFVLIFFAAFILYAIACLLILPLEKIDRVSLVGIFALAAGMLVSLVFTQPALSDDMYRYIWDGRVQAHGISPYLYPPKAPELAFLRDTQIYPWINRKPVVTVYPPAAEATFFLLWSIVPDNIHWFQVVMAGGAVMAGLLLTGLLHDLGRSDRTRGAVFMVTAVDLRDRSFCAYRRLGFTASGGRLVGPGAREGWMGGFPAGSGYRLQVVSGLAPAFFVAVQNTRKVDGRCHWLSQGRLACFIYLTYSPAAAGCWDTCPITFRNCQTRARSSLACILC